ncbi:MAG TPA: rhomboid family intramembrane serine protease [Acidimicrobiales bacterium]|nr:rhomboid family intramembrane serine protease [Acidimicrobiales bacterium]
MLPLKDHNPTEHLPWVTIVLIAANVVIFLLVQRPYDQGLNSAEFTYHYAAIPCELTVGRPLSQQEARRTLRLNDDEACERGAEADASPPVFPGKQVYLAVIYSMFLHGSWLHIGGNMLFMWVFGNNIEDRMGWLPYLLFYLLAGVVATLAHVAVQPASTVPLIGASGAVAGVMGAYLVLFPHVQIRSLLIFVIVLIRDIPAKWLLGFWFVFQFFTNPADGVAWVAHVGGFVFGAAVAFLLRGRLRPARAPHAPLPQF